MKNTIWEYKRIAKNYGYNFLRGKGYYYFMPLKAGYKEIDSIYILTEKYLK